ncbi:uncharacterized protein CTRU02_207171 [Colletotrichum truncatum]|uniref:Uncharacterized protein n=1 Tax=Colletotrichum truncatum TaxID=5467 RepID=A0ACC3Z078_COLTU|nr:uncharacterized protein CTRU02_01199 [Colletotrichum truncatum]KAF6800794.1 hypothetical protein CTRU02_01199 [Colletotrichum truncatum]
MAEPIGVASGAVTFASLAFKSSIALYNAIQGYRKHTSKVQSLLDELKALSEVLRLLTETIDEYPDIDFSALELPLQQCDEGCKAFKEELLKCSSRSTGDRTSFRDWAKLQYLGDGIGEFTQIIANYKSTINIALAEAQIRQSATTAEQLEKCQAMIQTTTADLEERLDTIDSKLAAVLERNVNQDDPDAKELQRIRAERASTQQCLDICTQLAKHIDRIQRQRPASPSTPVGAGTYPNRVTDEGLEACKKRLTQTVAELEEHMHKLMHQLMDKSTAKMINKDELEEFAKLQKEAATARQCLDICFRAESHVKENISIIDNYSTGDDTIQWLVSTNGKTIHGKNRGYGALIRQVGGHLNDVSVQQISKDFLSLHNGGRRRDPREDDEDPSSDERAGNESSYEFMDRYGRGKRL